MHARLEWPAGDSKSIMTLRMPFLHFSPPCDSKVYQNIALALNLACIDTHRHVSAVHGIPILKFQVEYLRGREAHTGAPGHKYKQYIAYSRNSKMANELITIDVGCMHGRHGTVVGSLRTYLRASIFEEDCYLG
jgi:hypothetical protein